MLDELIGSLVGSAFEPFVGRATERLTSVTTTRVLIGVWVVCGSLFAIGCYLLATATTVVLVGIGAACVIISLPAGIAMTFMWRARRLRGKHPSYPNTLRG